MLSPAPGPRVAHPLLIVAALCCCVACASPAPDPLAAALPRAAGAGWTAVGSLKEARELHQAVIVSVGGSPRVLLIGGRGATGSALASVESYDLSSHVVTAAAPMSLGRWGHSAAALANGKVLVVGGFTGQGPTAAVELYDPATNSWTPGPALAAPRYGHTAVTLPISGAQHVLIVGGRAASGGAPLTSAERLQPGPTQHWLPAGALTQGRADHRATLLADGRVLLSGGTGPSGKLTSTEIFDPQTVAWTPGPLLSAARLGHDAARLMDGSVLIAGGESAAVELFFTVPDRVLALNGLGSPRSEHTLTAVAGNKAVLVGGLGSGGAASHIDAVHVFDGATRTWDTVDSTLNTARRGHLATLLGTGRILISGGRGQAGALSSLELSKPYGSPAAPGDAGARDGDGGLGATDGDGPGAADGGDGAATGQGCACAMGVATRRRAEDASALLLLPLLLLLLVIRAAARREAKEAATAERWRPIAGRAAAPT
jgi:Kelch motif/Galactose oxidase, central domain